MKLYGREYPKPIPGNALTIVRVCKAIHQDFLAMRRVPKNTGSKEWHKYWVRACEAVEKVLFERKGRR